MSPSPPAPSVTEAERGDPVPVPGRHARPARLRAPALPGLVHLGPGQVAVLAVLVAVALAMTAWWVLRGQPRELAPVTGVAPVVSGSLPTGSPSGSPPASEQPAGEVVVDVAGKVRRPGLVVLDAGSRVADALDAAGGARPGVDLSSLNLARPLVDGEQVLVGVEPVTGVAPSVLSTGATAPGTLVNLNSADQTALESLPEVGPVTAASILAWREEHGGFTSVDELLEVDGIGEATLAQIAPFVTL